LFKVLANAWKVKEIRDKLIYVALVLLVYRIGTTLPLPGMNLDMLTLARGYHDAAGVQTMLQLMMGGGYGSIMAMGIAPYITASIIMQLLTVAFPKLSEIQKEGEEGRKRISQYTRRFAVGLAFIQAGAMVFSYVNNPHGIPLFYYNTFLMWATATIAMVTGTIFIMWLAELLTENGIGNGASFLIFANILASLPMGFGILQMLVQDAANPFFGVIQVLAVLVMLVLIMALVVRVHEGERRIPMQYSKKMAAGMRINPYIPIKVNIAGVMSLIFAISVVQFPQQVRMLIPRAAGAETNFFDTIIHWLSFQHPVGIILYIVLIFVFTFFYTGFAVNVREMAQGFKTNGGFIPGIRPGKPTEEYVQKIVDRLSWIGACFYSLIAVIPIVFELITGIPAGFGGTTLMIATGVALEFVKQLESQLLMRHYKGFLS
jgi:preprotein translocase subunit SecY